MVSLGEVNSKCLIFWCIYIKLTITNSIGYVGFEDRFDLTEGFMPIVVQLSRHVDLLCAYP